MVPGESITDKNFNEGKQVMKLTTLLKKILFLMISKSCQIIQFQMETWTWVFMFCFIKFVFGCRKAIEFKYVKKIAN